MEPVRYSAWRASAPARAEASHESLRALFQSRYPNKMNRVARAFLEAYAAAARETIRAGDRFPNLQEVQRKMAGGDACTFKHRLAGTASLFREVDLRPQGVFCSPRPGPSPTPAGPTRPWSSTSRRGACGFRPSSGPRRPARAPRSPPGARSSGWSGRSSTSPSSSPWW